MDVWPQREQFRLRFDAWKKARQLTTAEASGTLQVTEGTLKALLYRKTYKPGLEILQRAAAVFGCSVSEFIDDPGASAGGVDVAELRPEDRAFMRAIGSDLTKLTPQQVENAKAAWKAIVKGMTDKG
jgi:transcriptional regulator with XRE-family HTH domain